MSSTTFRRHARRLVRKLRAGTGRVTASGTAVCGLCGGGGSVEGDLRPWRTSRAHGTVHRRCLRVWRARRSSDADRALEDAKAAAFRRLELGGGR